MKVIHYFSIISLFILAACGNNRDQWYQIRKIDSGTYIISEPFSSQGNSSFLLMGDKEAFLFDAGTGENKSESIIHVAEKITNLPLTLVLSHFHFDHIGNVNDFSRTGLPDILSLKDRLSDSSEIGLSREETLTSDTVRLRISELLPVDTDIDLGKRKIKILHTPGHSAGSISIIDNENGYIFTGDLIYNGLLLIDNCDAYINSINKLLDYSDTGYRVFGSHGKPEVNYERLKRVKSAIGYYCTDSCSIKPVRRVNLFGTTKNLYEVDGVSFIDGYTDVFINN